MTEIEVDVKIIYPLNFQFLEMESGNQSCVHRAG